MAVSGFHNYTLLSYCLRRHCNNLSYEASVALFCFSLQITIQLLCIRSVITCHPPSLNKFVNWRTRPWPFLPVLDSPLGRSVKNKSVTSSTPIKLHQNPCNGSLRKFWNFEKFTAHDDWRTNRYEYIVQMKSRICWNKAQKLSGVIRTLLLSV